MSIDRSCQLHVISSGSATSIVTIGMTTARNQRIFPLTLIRITQTDSTGNKRSSTTYSYTQSAWDMENSFTVKKEHKGRLLERTVSVLSKAHFLQKDSKPPFSWHPPVVLYKVGTQSSVLINQVSLFQRRPTAVCILSKGSLL